MARLTRPDPAQAADDARNAVFAIGLEWARVNGARRPVLSGLGHAIEAVEILARAYLDERAKVERMGEALRKWAAVRESSDALVDHLDADQALLATLKGAASE